MYFNRPTRYLVIIFLSLLQNDLSSEGRDVIRTKRNAFQMCSLVNLYTQSSCFRYNPYGCFCGYGQQGSTPVDDADRCCKEHDDCYGEVHSHNHCNFWSGLFVGYTYNCDQACRCTDVSKCARKVCECDLQLASCLGKSSYTEEYKNYDRSQCR